MSDDDYEHPIAVPLMWLVVGTVMTAVNVEDALLGDWLSAAAGFGGLLITGMGGFDLFKRWRRSRA